MMNFDFQNYTIKNVQPEISSWFFLDAQGLKVEESNSQVNSEKFRL